MCHWNFFEFFFQTTNSSNPQNADFVENIDFVYMNNNQYTWEKKYEKSC